MDRVFINGIRVYSRHGCSPEEQVVGQTLEIDVSVSMDLRQAGMTDDLTQTADYGHIYQIAVETALEAQFQLLESIAERIASKVLIVTGGESVLVRVAKLHPPVQGVCDRSGVEIERTRQDHEPRVTS